MDYDAYRENLVTYLSAVGMSRVGVEQQATHLTQSKFEQRTRMAAHIRSFRARGLTIRITLDDYPKLLNEDEDGISDEASEWLDDQLGADAWEVGALGGDLDLFLRYGRDVRFLMKMRWK